MLEPSFGSSLYLSLSSPDKAKPLTVQKSTVLPKRRTPRKALIHKKEIVPKAKPSQRIKRIMKVIPKPKENGAVRGKEG